MSEIILWYPLSPTARMGSYTCQVQQLIDSAAFSFLPTAAQLLHYLEARLVVEHQQGVPRKHEFQAGHHAGRVGVVLCAYVEVYFD